MTSPIYLDHNATTPLAPEVLEAMLPYLQGAFGNAGSAHSLGIQAEAAVQQARHQVAACLGADPAEIVFTSGGTESLNHAFRGAVEAQPSKRHVVVSAVEHSAVLALVEWMRGTGLEVTQIPVDRHGCLDFEALEAALRPDTALVSVMAANNETGVLFSLPEVAARVKPKGILLHTDATQAVGRVPVDVKAWGVDLLSFSGHKLQGPKGTGVLYLRRGVRIKPLIHGGGQERGRRGGTENVPGVVGLGHACTLVSMASAQQQRALRDAFERSLQEAWPESVIHGQPSPRLPNTTLVSFPDVDAEALLLRLDQHGVCVSVGSACTTGRPEPSHVLRAMGVAEILARGTLRFSLGPGTTAEALDRVLVLLKDLVPACLSSSAASFPPKM